MAKRTKTRSKREDGPAKAKGSARPAKNPILSIDLGQSFAEYDPCIKLESAYVLTPALRAAQAADSRHCFFVGRRGTGKTATSLFLSRSSKEAIQVLPQQMVPDDFLGLKPEEFLDTRQQPFKSAVVAFKRTLALEALRHWLSSGCVGRASLPPELTKYLNSIEQASFDERLGDAFAEGLSSLRESTRKRWLRFVKSSDIVLDSLAKLSPKPRSVSLLVDRVDEAWDGTDSAVVFLMALMHASIELAAASDSLIRPVIFLRENIFERVRQLDNEFARLETSVVSMDWTIEQLRELIERRINLSMIAKKPLGGATWDAVFEGFQGVSSIDYVASYCQHRPRDVLTYCSFAVDSAKARMHNRVEVSDLLAARKRFSDSRLKDLGDEYAENFPQISLVLGRFFGLGTKYTLNGVASFIQRLLVDGEVQQQCATWLNSHTAPEAFADLLYRISFFGISNGEAFEFRTHGARSTAAPRIAPQSMFMIHPCFEDALHLQDQVIARLDETFELKEGGVVRELPEGTSLSDYQQKLADCMQQLDELPRGRAAAEQFESIVGTVVRLCFFKSLSNVDPKQRTSDGRSIRDWICANTASRGFWEMIRMRYGATQVIWECKNYDDLKAEDFYQANAYMGKALGRCVVVAFRGEVSGANMRHVHEIVKDRDGIVLLVGQKDLKTFLRQAIKSKDREAHIQGIYDRIARGA